LSLFLACFASIGYEIAPARFFALSSRSEYGHWVISIAMVGLAAGGAVASLALNPLVRLAVGPCACHLPAWILPAQISARTKKRCALLSFKNTTKRTREGLESLQLTRYKRRP
jgi:hypothetical protein